MNEDMLCTAISQTAAVSQINYSELLLSGFSSPASDLCNPTAVVNLHGKHSPFHSVE